MTISGTASVQQDLSPSDEASYSAVGGMMSTSQVGGTTLGWLYKSGDVG